MSFVAKASAEVPSTQFFLLLSGVGMRAVFLRQNGLFTPLSGEN